MKEFRIFSFFVEPGSYTLDLIKNVHDKMKINYIFLNSHSHAKTETNPYVHSLKEYSFYQQITYVIRVFKNNRFIVFNGYNHWQFFLLFLLNIASPKKRIIAIDSDTRYRKRTGFKGLLKKIYLTPIFSNKYIFGFAGGNHSHKDLFRNYGMKEENLFLMPMMVDNEKFYMQGDKPESPFTFLFVGRMIPLKQIELLIRSFLENFENDMNVQLKIVGGGELFEPLLSKYGHHKNIEFTGPKYDEDLVAAYHSSHVLILPSDREQWGLVINEALAAGLPVIASDQVGAIYDLILGRNTGLVFSLKNPEELAKHMKTLQSDKELYEKMSHNAVHLMRHEWNYDLYKKELNKAIERAKEILKTGERR